MHQENLIGMAVLVLGASSIQKNMEILSLKAILVKWKPTWRKIIHIISAIGQCGVIMNPEVYGSSGKIV